MGLFSALGTIGGLIFGGSTGAKFGNLIGGGLDGLAAGKEKRDAIKKANKSEMDKYVRLREAAERGGYHPLEVLRAGGSVGYTARPSLMSSLASTNAFDALEHEITGEGAKERKRQQVEDEIRERQLEQMKNETVAQLTRSLQGNKSKTISPQVTPQDAPLQNEVRPNLSSQPYAQNDKFTPPWLASAEDAEAYGWEIGGAIQGVTNMLAVVPYNKGLSDLASYLGKTEREIHNKIAGMSGTDGKKWFQDQIAKMNRAVWGNPIETKKLRPALITKTGQIKSRPYDHMLPQ